MSNFTVIFGTKMPNFADDYLSFFESASVHKAYLRRLWTNLCLVIWEGWTNGRLHVSLGRCRI